MRYHIAAAVVVLIASLVWAQEYVPGGSSGTYIPGYGFGGGSIYGHASTEAEGAQRGFADVVRSAGAANLMNSEAAKNYEDARRKYIENRLEATETFFEMRRVNAESRAVKRPRPLSTEQYVRLARQQAPARLSVSQFDPLSGTINWPAVLRREQFSTDRQAIEALFKERASGVDTNSAEIDAACRAMLDRLRPEAQTLNANDFIQARRFVESLAHEARLLRG
ncbi:MAG: hypothetical protein L0211_06435 [Planctomycetaceae bacterium]|nr:hypothetical protein [Planctomycetaceae bacterium]